MQLASKILFAILVIDSCRRHPLTIGNWVTNISLNCRLVSLPETSYFVWQPWLANLSLWTVCHPYRLVDSDL